MASLQGSGSFIHRNKILMFDHDAGDTSANDVSWQDMRDYDELTVTIFASSLGGNGATAFTILANSESDGSGSDVEIKAHAVGSAPDAVGDWLVLSCTAEELAGLGTDLRYVSASLTLQNSGDENVVTYLFSHPKFPQANLTADTVA